MISPLAFAAGALGWSLAEYTIHRFVGHGPPKKSGRPPSRLAGLSGDFGAEHLKHHVDPAYFAPTSAKVKAGATVLSAGGVVLSFLGGPRFGVSYTLGFGAMYTAYEIAHRRAHTHAPTGPYSRWLRKHHLHHHYGSPKVNHGVTSPLWDLVFRTFEPTGTVRVPDVRAPEWMVDDAGNLRPEHAQDYELVRKAKKPVMKDRSRQEAA